MNRRKLIGELLSILERKESRLLSWGFLDVSFSAEEIVETFKGADRINVESLEEWMENTSIELFVDDLAQANLLVRVNSRYRSRFAETIRLLGRLRQRFSNNDWATAPSLVSDLKIHLAARTYPKRNVSSVTVWEQIREVCWATPVQRYVFEALANYGNKKLDFAGFQVRATQRILSNYQPTVRSNGTVISAGTGSGKTKAFYIPAFMGIAADIAQDGRDFTKVLAVYPRNVLLADQFTEAIAQAKLLLQADSPIRRPVTFGAYLGSTPYTANLSPGQYALKDWKQSRLGWIPPFIKHPDDGSDLVWLDSDRILGRTTLRAAVNPDQIVIPDGMIRLTRDLIRRRPPDVLMISMEMLNKEMCSPINEAMLGFKNSLPAPRLVLLDEVHTYEGVSGAQVPWILRRWNYWVRRRRTVESNPHYVGLSATLKEASLHLSGLVGISESGVAEIKPEESLGELESEGIEYNVALKSHPGSGASVLATSIQAVMLGARTLTPSVTGMCDKDQDNLSPQCFFGKKVFGFTDNLDGLNRWMADFVDADRKLRLARFRATAGLSDIASRSREGQVWKLCEDIGHDLNQALFTSRCSSQDPGVDSRSNVVLATSSLEVGYDDPDVGMVVHHKAPRSSASFLQRKGRAGRQRGIRPWTVVVLSDYGRDRWMFRDTGRLFSPELDALKIPALNSYVVRIQATQFLVDWIGKKVGQGEPYRYLSKSDPSSQQLVKNLLNELLTNEGKRNEFVRDLTYWLRGGAVGLRLADPDALTDSVLWEPPRAVLRHAIPELAKVLVGDFRPLGDADPIKQKRPLPRFIPAATFGELDAQDVEIQFGNGRDPENVDIAVALREAPPCRVSRRYAVEVRERSLWPECSESIMLNRPTTVAMSTLFPESLAIGSAEGVDIFQPLVLRLVSVPDRVKDSSRGEWDWKFKADFIGSKERLGIIDGPVLSRVFSSCEGYFHRRYAHTAVTRYSEKFEYEIVFERGDKQRAVVDLASENDDGGTKKQAVGYRRLVDAIVFKIAPGHIANIPPVEEEMLERLRPLYFRYRLRNSPLLNAVVSPFGIQALWNSSVAMLTTTALLKKTSLKDAAGLLANRSDAAKKVFECILLGEMAADLTEDTGGGGATSTNRRIKEIQELWQKKEIKDEVCRLESTLWDTRDEGFEAWLVKIYIETLAAVLEQTIWTVTPEIPEGDITVDVTSGEDGYGLVLSEVTSGGVGHLERLIVEIGNAPERFDATFEAAIKSCENDRLTRALLASAEKAKSKTSSVSMAFEQVRSATSFGELNSAKQSLIDSLADEALANDRSAVTAIVSNVLRPGSSRMTDLWARALGRRRLNLGKRIGILFDQRVFAYWCVQTPAMERRMREYLRQIGQQDPTPDQVFNAFAQLTFLNCSDSCPECLGVGKEMEGIVPSRELAAIWIDLDSIDFFIDIDKSEDWKATLSRALRDARRIRIAFTDRRRTEVVKQLNSLLAEEHDRGYIFSPFTTVSATNVASRWEVTLHPSGDLAW